jgi:peroxiredoxin
MVTSGKAAAGRFARRPSMSERTIPDQQMPELTLSRVGADTPWSLQQATPDNFILLICYRGHHCPLCKKQLEAFSQRVAEFDSLGTQLVAISCDKKDKAEKTASEWNIGKLSLAYGLAVDKARALGLYVSSAIKDAEPDYFSEPGLFLIYPGGKLHAAWIQSVPNARPSVQQILDAVKFTLENDYPPRGDVTDEKLTEAA